MESQTGCKPEAPPGLKRGNPRHDVMRCVLCHADGCRCSHYEHDTGYVTLKSCRACGNRGDHWTAGCPDIAQLDEPPLGTYVTREDLIRWAAKDWSELSSCIMQITDCILVFINVTILFLGYFSYWITSCNKDWSKYQLDNLVVLKTLCIMFLENHKCILIFIYATILFLINVTTRSPILSILLS